MRDKRSALTAVTGTGFREATFVESFCTRDQEVTPHSAGRVLSRSNDKIEIGVRCRRCGLQAVYATYRLPVNYRIFHVRITGEDGPHLPDQFRPVPYVEEEFEVIGISCQDAHERAEFAHTLSLVGQLTKFYINGELHLDERF